MAASPAGLLPQDWNRIVGIMAAALKAKPGEA